MQSMYRDNVSFAVTSRWLLAAVFAIPLVSGGQIAAARSQGQRPLQVSFSTPTTRPGDVARIDVDGLDGRERITATMFDQDLAFFFDETQQRWSALVGIDLETKPGVYRLRLQRAGSTTRTTRTLTVVQRRFRVRHLRVADDYA